MRKTLYLCFFFGLMVFSPKTSEAQFFKKIFGGKKEKVDGKPKKAEQSEADFDENKEDQQAKQDEIRAEGRKRHVAMQDKPTKKRMKKAKRTSKRNNKNRKPLFFKKWFIKR